jgi:hypothetical protein
MRRVNAIALTAVTVLAAYEGSFGPARAQVPVVTVFEGARLIVGDGRPA